MTRLALMLALLAGLVAPTQAADTPEPAPPTSRATADPLAGARAHINAKRYLDAVGELQRINATLNADWNNLMGYALRKKTPADLHGAGKHYDAALKIDPNHRGALEYSGELALMQGQLAVAEERLAVLVRVCPSGCEERGDLERGIARFKRNGNRWVP